MAERPQVRVKLTVLNSQVDLARRRLALSQRGQGMVEYALILILVSVVAVVILLTMGTQIRNAFSNVVLAINP